MRLIILLMLLLVPIASASYITITTTITSNQDDIDLSISNHGDEPAYNVQATIKLLDIEQSSDIKSQLNINEFFKPNFKIDTKSFALPGSYPVIAIIDYSDANGYKFSALSSSIYINEKATISKINLAMQPIELSKSGKIKLTLKNLDSKEKNLDVELITPRELTIDNNKISTQLSSKEEKTLKFEIQNFAARPGSSYAVFAVSNFEENNQHFSSLTSTTIKITSGTKLFSARSLLILLVILIVVAIFFQFFRRKK